MRENRTSSRPKRILIYSHDTFGLGHLRRCRAIANALVTRDPSIMVMLLSGSSVIGSFDFAPGVEFIRLPSVIKRDREEYVGADPGISLSQTLALRARILRDTAEIFCPDLFLVDKEPLGVRGEVLDSLAYLHGNGTKLVLGLREVLEEPDALREEWLRKGAFSAIESYYDEIWVYGPDWFYDPLCGQQVSARIRDGLIFTGFLGEEDSAVAEDGKGRFAERKFILVTAGGGGDGGELFDWVAQTIATDNPLPEHVFVFVLGPFLPQGIRSRLYERFGEHPRICFVDFETRMESWLARADGVVAMGGYNTFCELMAYDCRTLLIPRSYPRKEQSIRSFRAEEVGLCDVLTSGGGIPDVGRMTDALNCLVKRKRPSEVSHQPLFGAIDVILDRVRVLLAAK